MASTRTTARMYPGQDGVGFEETDSVSESSMRTYCSGAEGGAITLERRHDCLSVEER
jgi:hypothetical protein